MTEKRYSIVRVDGICPLYLEQRTYKCEMGNFTCEKCYTYGDTKEQMIKKVAIAILRTLKDGEVLKYEKFGTGFIKQPVSIEYLAEKIVEFIGVE